MTVSEAVARRISNLLKERNMTQYRLEKNSNIQHGTMQCIMNGRNKTVTLSIVIMIANGFGMTVDEFLDDPLFKSEELEVE
ncbi:MAG: helix-turn-helix transcriptional regulator [Clostridia bacterium]|nr:helix-turn-helix transcriptional regulator [Clostridia bacterium]MBO7151223.1 helix-turn-helix transcriptional regulator [Clostridia bacterium]MBR5173773.1 helix-turn-helix transcriptional regulator [Clostridia bacterium]